ncbi:hypothetical protein DU500_09120 [Haloplanus rubicundus]|uniref:Uncharacterized protein n=2 Tax=Haloplanus rubicundus TaxID=1547898 RepID=A0A345E302_9EURY|nr:hypothetical protein DU500_09120 [Haloplanus rubicundus]
MLILTPLRYGIGFIEWAGAMIDGSFVVVQTQVTGAFEPVEEAILGSDSSQGVTDMVFGGLESGLMDAGLGAPLAATLTVVVLASLLTVLIYALLRVGADAVPGVGGLIR